MLKLKNGDIVTAQRAYVAIAKAGDCGVVVDAPQTMRCYPGTLVLVTPAGYIVIDAKDVISTGRELASASFEACNSARLRGTLGQALTDGKLSNYIEQAVAATEHDKAIQAHLREACEHKVALHVDAAISVVDTDPVEADSWAYEAGRKAWDFDLKAPEKLALYLELSAAFKRGFDRVEQAHQRELSNYIEHPASGKTGTFSAKYDQHAERNGQTFTVLGAVDPSTYDAAECGDMYVIRFADGLLIEAWPDEVTSAFNVTNHREPTKVYETGSDDTFWNAKVVLDVDRFNVQVYDADGDRRSDREDSFVDRALAIAFADRAVCR